MNETKKNQISSIESIAELLLNFQERIANIFQCQFEKLSIHSKKSLVVIFCLTSICFNSFLLHKLFARKTEKSWTTTTGRIEPARIDIKSSKYRDPAIYSGDEKIKKLRAHFDSLAETEAGKELPGRNEKDKTGNTDSLKKGGEASKTITK